MCFLLLACDGWPGALLYTVLPRLAALEHCYLQDLPPIVCASTANSSTPAHFGVQVLQIAVLQSFGVLGDI